MPGEVSQSAVVGFNISDPSAGADCTQVAAAA